MKVARHVVAVLVENKPGVLSRVVGLVSRRGFNIESLSVAPTDNPDTSLLITALYADDVLFEQVSKQLNKLISVIKVTDLTKADAVERELLLIKVTAESSLRREIMDVVELFDASIVDVGIEHLTIEFTGDDAAIEKFISVLSPFGIKDMVRTGVIAVSR